MPNIIAESGRELNSAFLLGSFQDHAGLILESWGPSSRNSDYNLALEAILTRLQRDRIDQIGVNVISKDLVQLYPHFKDRAIRLGGDLGISLQEMSPKDLRLAIGRAQAGLKSDPTRMGGNRTKRILLHSPDLTDQDWVRIAAPPLNFSDGTIEEVALPIPAGNLSPRAVTQTIVVIERDQNVRSWILKNAEGLCESCHQPAPFVGADGQPFLEVHHVIALASNGSDTITNSVALCPNCHRELHYGMEKVAKLQRLYAQIQRLIEI